MIYCIGTRLNNKDWLVMNDVSHPSKMSASSYAETLSYPSLELAKKCFMSFYKVLDVKEWDSPEYLTALMGLVEIRPVIVGCSKETIFATFARWMAENRTYTSAVEIVPVPHVLCPMKAGFLDKFCQLDLIKDIEGRTRISQDGKIMLQKISIESGSHTDCTDTLTPEERANLLIKERGFQ